MAIRPKKSADSDSGFLASRIKIWIPIFSQHKYLNFKIGKIEWQIQQICTNDKHLHEDFGILNSLNH